MKKLFVVAVVLAMAALLAGCGGTLEEKRAYLEVVHKDAVFFSAWTAPGNYYVAIYPDGSMVLSIREFGSY